MKDTRCSKILIDTREKEESLYELLYKDKGDIIVEDKVGGVGDYIIVDKKGNQWGIERKKFIECYNAIITKEDDKTTRINGQLAQLVAEFGDRAIFLLEDLTYIPKNIRIPAYQLKQSVMTYFSEKSLMMPTFFMRDSSHTAYFLKKMARNIHALEFRGRGFTITLDTL